MATDLILPLGVPSRLRRAPEWALPPDVGRAFDRAYHRGEKQLKAGDPQAAASRFRTALKILLGFWRSERHPEAAVLYDQLAVCSIQAQDFGRAKQLNRHAVGLFRDLLKGRPDIDEAVAVFTGAQIGLHLRDFQAMEASFVAASDIVARLPWSDEVATYFAGMAGILAHNAMAAELPEISIAFRKEELRRLKALCPDPYDRRVTECMFELARGHLSTGEVAVAVEFAEAVVDMGNAADSAHVMNCAVVLLDAYAILQQKNRALDIAVQVESICLDVIASSQATGHPIEASTEALIGAAIDCVTRTYCRCKRSEDIDRLLPHLITSLARAMPAVARGGLLCNIGLAHRALGRHAEAEPFFRSAIDTLTSAAGRTRDIFLFTTYHNLGLALANLGRLQAAEAALDASLALSDSMAHGLRFADIHSCEIDRAAVLAAQGRHRETLDAVLAGRPGLEDVLGAAGKLPSEGDFTAYLQTCRAGVDLILFAVRQLPFVAPSLVTEIIAYCWLTKLPATRLSMSRGRTSYSGNAPADAPARGSEMSKTPNSSVAALRQQLDSDELLLEFFFFHDRDNLERDQLGWHHLPNRYCVAVIAKDAEPRLVFLDRSDLHDEITAAHAALQRRSAGQTRDRALERLGGKLLNPLSEVLIGKGRLLISPDGRLAQIPFEVLPGAHRPFRIQEHLIAYVTSGLDLVLNSGTGPPDGERALVIADPDFDLGGAGARRAGDGAGQSPAFPHNLRRLRRLSGAKAEGQRVAQILGAALLEGSDARKSAVMACRSPEVLHIATHGVAQMSRPDGEFVFTGSPGSDGSQLAIFLAGANDTIAGRTPYPSVDDGILTARDLQRLDLNGTALVTFSACRTAHGDWVLGEGLWGLGRSALIAGAASVVTSLWNVPDKPTERMMVRFYEGFRHQGLPLGEALHRAKLDLLADGADLRAWGAFVLLCQRLVR